MERFECRGQLRMTLDEGATIVRIIHEQSHKPYVSIDLLDKWCTFIKENHRMGPAKVCK